jgi:4-hydroxy-3-polyprenylbenzoate decarboxylase
MTTRFQADVDVITIPGVRCHPLDPSQSPEMSSSIRGKGITCKAIFDCTVPFDQKSRFERAKFMDVELDKFLVPSANPYTF